MTVARSVADVLSGHVRFEVECIDRMYLNVYQSKLQYAAGPVGYVHRQLGLPIASTAPLAKITDRFVAAVHRFADASGGRVAPPRVAANAEPERGWQIGFRAAASSITGPVCGSFASTRRGDGGEQ